MDPWRWLARSTHPRCWFWETDPLDRLVWITESVTSASHRPEIWRQGDGEENLAFPQFDLGQQAELQQLLWHREPFHDFTARMTDAHGTKVLSFSGAPFTDRHGEFQGYRGTVHNSTISSGSHDRAASGSEPENSREHRLHTELKETRDRLMAFAESASDWFWESDEIHHFTFISEAFDLITGLSRDEWIGQSRYAFAIEAGLNPETWAAHQSDLDSRRPFRNFCFAYRRSNGEEAWINVSGRPVLDDNGNFTGYRGTSKEVTDQVVLEKALRRALEDAKAANDAKTGFLSSMSHELRTPLNGVLGFAQLLKMDDDNSLTELQMEAVDQVLNCGNHLLALIEDVLDLSRIDQRQLVMEIIDIHPTTIIEESLAIIRNQIRKSGLELEVTGLDGEVDRMVRADLGRAKQVLLNLLTNAIK